MFDRCFSSAASHPSTPPPSQDSAADVQQKSCIVSAPYVNLARPLQPIRHVKLNHFGILISLWEQQPQCHKGNGQWVVHCMKALLSCYLSIWWFLPWMWHPVFSGCQLYVLLVISGQQAGPKAGYRLGRYSICESLCSLGRLPGSVFDHYSVNEPARWSNHSVK